MSNTLTISRPGPEAAAILAATDPAALSDQDLIDYTQAADRQLAHTNALALAAVRVLADRAAGVQHEISDALARHTTTPDRGDHAGTTESFLHDHRAGAGDDVAAASQVTPARRRELVDRAGVIEVAQTLRVSQYTAARRIQLARLLADRLAPAGDALRDGQLSLGHAWVLAEHTEDIDDDATLAALQAACLPRAPGQTPGNFGKSLTRALHALDPHGQARRHRAARRRARVYRSQDHDGMATPGIVATDPETEWAYTILDTLARAKLHQLKTTTSAAAAVAAGCGPDGVQTTPATGNSADADTGDETLCRSGHADRDSACGPDGVETMPSLQLLTVGATTAGGEQRPAPVEHSEAADHATCGRDGVDPVPVAGRASTARTPLTVTPCTGPVVPQVRVPVDETASR